MSNDTEMSNGTTIFPAKCTLSRPFTDKGFHITLRVNISNVNISTAIYPPLKQNPPLKSSQNNLSNGGTTAVKTLHKPKQS
jgi:hypothetical protein